MSKTLQLLSLALAANAWLFICIAVASPSWTKIEAFGGRFNSGFWKTETPAGDITIGLNCQIEFNGQIIGTTRDCEWLNRARWWGASSIASGFVSLVVSAIYTWKGTKSPFVFAANFIVSVCTFMTVYAFDSYNEAYQHTGGYSYSYVLAVASWMLSVGACIASFPRFDFKLPASPLSRSASCEDVDPDGMQLLPFSAARHSASDDCDSHAEPGGALNTAERAL